jgi:hypothetical protein
MTHEEKITYTQMALSLVGITFNKGDVDMIVSICELINEKQGKTDIDSIIITREQVKHRNKNRNNYTAT